MSAGDVSSKYYTGKFEHGVDEKRRLQVPAKWRAQAEGVEFAVIVWPKAKEGPCLRVLPPAKFAKLSAEIDAMPGGEEKGTLKRIIGSNSEHCALDKGGRIYLPQEMMVAAGIVDKAILVGCMDQIEIWSPEKFKAVMMADAVKTPDAFKMME